MVCDRCIKVVKDELEAIGLQIESISLGEVSIEKESEPDFHQIAETLSKAGFELMEDKSKVLIEKIKTLVIEIIHHKKIKPDLNFSEIISKSIGKDYSSLSNLFSSKENITIEKYIILQRIERAKELLKYNELSTSEIAFDLGYSSVSHLSSQFKQVTGMSPAQFKKIKGDRNPLDKV